MRGAVVFWKSNDMAQHGRDLFFFSSMDIRCVPVFWALMKATLLVSGLRRMNPHSRCMGFLVSGWKALNLRGYQDTKAAGGCTENTVFGLVLS